MSNRRRKNSPESKEESALTAVCNEQTIAELSSQYDVQSTMINDSKRALFDDTAEILGKAKKFVSKISPRWMNCFD